MPGDYSRKTFDPIKHYSGVLMQQGRVQLDADWNAQIAIQQHRTQTEAGDVIGTCGVPKKLDGFNIGFIPDGSDLTISPGRMYVDGILCELEASPVPVTFPAQANQVVVPVLIVDGRALEVDQWVEISAASGQKKKLLRIIDLDKDTGVLTFAQDVTEFQIETDAAIRRVTTYLTQQDYPNPDDSDFIITSPAGPVTSPPASPPTSPPASADLLNIQDGTYLAYLDVCQNEINFRDDPRIQEKALGEADTATRLKTVWQVKLLQVHTELGEDATCQSAFAEWDEITAPSTGMLNARTRVTEDQPDPCLLPPSAGYRRLENQLYRVEVHTSGTRDNATFKWSRDNGSVETRIEKIDGSIVTVSDIGKDAVLGFGPGQWVEIVDDESTLKQLPYPLVQIDQVDPATREIIMAISLTSFEGKPNLKLRRWDQNDISATADGVNMSADWIPLEGGIEVQFSQGYYHSGDYWLIPARTATGDIEWPPFEIPNTRPIPQPPVGIRHHHCRLALIEVLGGVVVQQYDCRDLFPSLTEIHAEDVWFDNQHCQLPDAKTVQEALDVLCAAQDLRHHNKHLHGHGVVCGLKVKCGAARNEIIVEKGYALDCEGFPINVQQEIPYNIVAESQVLDLLDDNGDGEVCLSVARSSTRGAIISIEPHVKENFWDSVLEGTLLKDFYEDCIESLIIFLASQFPTSLTDTPPVPTDQRRLTSILNLLAQLINSASGPYAFLSRDEDALLRNFYEDLKAFIASETFCAMFDGDRPFPPYDIDAGLETIFGPALRFHHRLRLHPSEDLAYTCGIDNKIYVYDLASRELIQTLEFPASKTVIVQDVAISAKESTLYAVGIQEDKDSVFATADIDSDGTHTWGPTSIECGVKYVRLALGPDPGNQLYAIQKAQGLFAIKDIGLPGFLTNTVLSFNATGLLELSPDGTLVFAAENSVTAVGIEASDFNKIIAIDVSASPPAILKGYPVSGNDNENDLTTRGDILYVTGDPAAGQTKSLWGFIITDGIQAFTPVDLAEDTITRLAVASSTPAGDFMLVTLADRFKVVRVDLATHTLDSGFRLPVQIFPTDIAVSSSGQFGYVLNPIVNTLTSIDLDVVFDPANPALNFTAEPPTVISDYRQGVIDAFTDLASHFLQYLKDCFCDKFLVDCPVCGQEDKVYLGCVEIRNGQVYNICNFTKRRYVKSFRTWGYWLSAVPVLPIIKKAFANFCSSVVDP